jgi:hypothetical protein
MLRRIFRPKREEVTGIVRVIKPRRLSYERHGTFMWNGRMSDLKNPL